MARKVLYYSRSGNSKRIAEKINKTIGGELIQITDTMNWKGVFGFIKAGYYSSTDKDMAISLSSAVGKDDELVVVAPLWAGGPAQPVRVFLRGHNLSKIHLVLNSAGSGIRKLDQRQSYSSVVDIVKNKANEEVLIDDLIKKL